MLGRFWIIGAGWAYSTNDPYEGMFMVENAAAKMFDRRHAVGANNSALADDPLMQAFANLEVN